MDGQSRDESSLTRHVPILKEEIVSMLALDRFQSPLFIDGTLGGGGHTRAILDAYPFAFGLGLDQDAGALEQTSLRLGEFASRMKYVKSNFSDLKAVLQSSYPEREKASGILLDLGFSSDQLDDPKRGLSFRQEGPLDMRLDPSATETAADLLNQTSRFELEKIFEQGGVGPMRGALAKAVVERRPFHSTITFAALCVEIFQKTRKHIRNKSQSETHPAAVPFQALRIRVNRELEHLQAFLSEALTILEPGARLLIICFHSLEDELVTRTMRAWSTAPAEFRHLPVSPPLAGRLLTKRAILAGAAEVQANPRSRSARLRVFERGDGGLDYV